MNIRDYIGEGTKISRFPVNGEVRSNENRGMKALGRMLTLERFDYGFGTESFLQRHLLHHRNGTQTGLCGSQQDHA